ncbi:MAG: TIGR03032 family protein [Saprospirales bacterium]|nr:TIGR03032 family protein [Saprospirales bacterium]MBK6902490.1 TIGR03032 family protein [Saprospirales bacterium]MBK7335732.1 TIGR03032 family protein [Saprospirales bacterium]
MPQQPGALPPFSCSFSPNIPELLQQLGCSLAISTYQAGKVVFISPKADGENLVQLPRTFKKAMGIALDGEKMAIATMEEVLVLVNSKELALYYPKQPNTYDALYMPRATYYTGQVDIHDLDYGEGGLYAVNTSFSCLIKIDDNYSFTPIWKPPFISKLVSEDRCHLNGMALENGKPRYVTAFGTGDSPQAWREVVTTGGILMDINSNEFIARELPMPHSPRMFDGQLYLLLSATGELVRLDLKSGKYDVVCKIEGFVRGLARCGDYAFIGLSRLRKNSSTFAKLKIADVANQAGIAVVHLPTGAFAGEIKYHMSVDEIYDVQVLPGMLRPGILNTDKPEFRMGLSTPGATYWSRPDAAETNDDSTK